MQPSRNRSAASPLRTSKRQPGCFQNVKKNIDATPTTTIQFSLAAQFDRTAVDGLYELVAGEKGWI